MEVGYYDHKDLMKFKLVFKIQMIKEKKPPCFERRVRACLCCHFLLNPPKKERNLRQTLYRNVG